MRGLAPLRHRDFALYWVGFSVSQVGDWMETATTTWLLYDITRSPVLLGLGGGIRAVAVITFGLIGGAVADRVPRRRLLYFTQTGFALSSLALGTLVVTEQVQFWHVYVFSAVNGALGAFDAPARRAMFPTLVPRSEMQNAVTLNASVFRVARLIGPAIAGVVIATYGPAVSYFVNVASYGSILAALAVMRIPEVVPRVRASLLREVMAGPRYTMGRPLLRSVLALETVHSLFGLNTALLTILASDVFRTGPQGLGLLLSAQAAGALAGTGALVAAGDIERKGRAMVIAGTLYAAAFAMLPLATAPQLAAAVVALLGLTDAFWATMRNTVFQLETDEAHRGRTMASLLLAGRGGAQASQLQTGLMVSAGGPALAALVGAAVIGASLLAVNLRTADVRRFRGRPDPVLTAVSAGTEHDAVE